MLMSRLQTGIRENRVYKFKMKRLSRAPGLDFHSFSVESTSKPACRQAGFSLNSEKNRSSLTPSPSFLIPWIFYAFSVIKPVIKKELSDAV